MKVTLDFDRLIAKSAEFAVKGYDKAKGAAPAAKDSVVGLKNRTKEAVKSGVKAARS